MKRVFLKDSRMNETRGSWFRGDDEAPHMFFQIFFRKSHCGLRMWKHAFLIPYTNGACSSLKEAVWLWIGSYCIWGGKSIFNFGSVCIERVCQKTFCQILFSDMEFSQHWEKRKPAVNCIIYTVVSTFTFIISLSVIFFLFAYIMMNQSKEWIACFQKPSMKFTRKRDVWKYLDTRMKNAHKKSHWIRSRNRL